MHPYATDSSERERIFSVLAVAVIGVVWLLHVTLGSFYWWWNPITIMGLYGVLYMVFGKVVWRAGFLHALRLVRTPDLSGRWQGKITLASRWLGKVQDATVTINQTWTRISVVFETETTKAQSLIASILTQQPEGPVLSYEYLNEPKPGAKDAFNIQRGSARLVLSGDTLEGSFYYGSGKQQQFGSLTVTRTPR
jgi:hypothetical protein